MSTHFTIHDGQRRLTTEVQHLDEYGPHERWVVRVDAWSQGTGKVDLSPSEARAAAAHLIACAEQVEALQRRKG